MPILRRGIMATLAEQIEHDLQAWIESGSTPPFPLTLHGIADHYGVSTMPVRAAVDQLLENRYLLKQPNGRLTTNPRKIKRSNSEPPRAPQRLISASHEHGFEDGIREEIVGKSLRQSSEFLREEATAQRYDVGRTVVRQMFSKLAGEGVIEHVARRGWRIRPFSERDMLSYLEVRELMEVQALRAAADQLVREDLEKLLEGNSPDAGGRPRIDDSLHRYWIDRSGNRYIRHFFDRHSAYFSSLFTYATQADPAMVEEAAADHRTILTALIHNRMDAAIEALVRHIRNQREYVVRALSRIRDSENPDNSN